MTLCTEPIWIKATALQPCPWPTGTPDSRETRVLRLKDRGSLHCGQTRVSTCNNSARPGGTCWAPSSCRAFPEGNWPGRPRNHSWGGLMLKCH